MEKIIPVKKSVENQEDQTEQFNTAVIIAANTMRESLRQSGFVVNLTSPEHDHDSNKLDCFNLNFENEAPGCNDPV